MSGPVFNLPDGYSANSPEADILNNAFTPEPSTWAMLATGAIALLLFRRRKSSHQLAQAIAPSLHS
jgi:hypothetical protein